VILTIIWRFQKLGKYWQEVKIVQKILMWNDSILRKLNVVLIITTIKRRGWGGGGSVMWVLC